MDVSLDVLYIDDSIEMNVVNKALQEYIDSVSEDVRVFTLSLIDMIRESNIEVIKDGAVVPYKILEGAAEKLAKDIKNIPKEKKRLNKELYPKKSGGFANPILITRNMNDFLLEVDFGSAYDESGNDIGPLRDYIPSIVNIGATTTGILTSLFSIYRQLTKNYDPNDKNYTIPTDLMMKYFSNEFKTIENEDAKDDSRTVKFKSDRFRTARLRTLFTHCTDKSITDDEKKELEELSEQLSVEQQHVKNTLAHLHRMNQ